MDKSLFRIDLASPVPRYYQIQQNIAELVEAGILNEGDVLPPERALAEIYGVSRLTVRQALESLGQSGFVRSLQGSGTYVSWPQVTQLMPNVIGFSERIRSAGKQPSSRVLRSEIIPGSASICRHLRINPDEPIICLCRLRLVDAEPLMLETSFLSSARFPNLLEENLETKSLYDVLRWRYSVSVHETEQTLEPTALHPEEAEHFGLKTGQPAMLVHVTAYSDDGQVIEYSKSVIRGDRCRYYLRVTTREPILGVQSQSEMGRIE